MKISDGKNVLDQHIAGLSAIRGGNGGAVGEAASAGGDRVTVSAAARDLARLRTHVGDLDGVREARVSTLRAAVASGQYRVDATGVARSVLRELLSDQVS